MTGRLPVCEDSAAITARLRELQAERMAAIAGCICGTLGPTQHDVAGNVVHEPTCPLRAAAPSKMEMAREAMRRARARVYGPIVNRADQHIEQAIAAKAARHRVMT